MVQLCGLSRQWATDAMLRAIFYSEFDNDVGPQVAYQYPEGYVVRVPSLVISAHSHAQVPIRGRL